MAPIVDPWGGYNQGMANLSNTLSDLSNAKRQREIDAVNLRRLALEEKSQGSLLAEREAKLSDLEAQRGALQQVYGAATPQEAYAAQMKEKMMSDRTERFFNHLGTLEKSGASPEFITNIAKSDLAKIPEYKDIVPNILFMNKDKLVSILDVKPGQTVLNPLTGEPLPPGRYEAEGKRTGDLKNPFALTSIKPFVDKEAMLEKRFEQQSELQDERQAAADARLEKQLSAADARQARALASAESRSGANRGKLQQSQYVDEDGTPLLFSPETGSYIRADNQQPTKTPARRLPAENVKEMATFDQLRDTAQGLLNDPQYKKFVGPVDSRLRRLKAATVGDESFSRFRARIESLIETSYALSGKQISEKEIKMLEKIRGALDNPDKSFKGAMEQYIEWVNNKAAGRGGTYKAGGYNPPKSSGSGKKPLSAY